MSTPTCCMYLHLCMHESCTWICCLTAIVLLCCSLFASLGSCGPDALLIKRVHPIFPNSCIVRHTATRVEITNGTSPTSPPPPGSCILSDYLLVTGYVASFFFVLRISSMSWHAPLSIACQVLIAPTPCRSSLSGSLSPRFVFVTTATCHSACLTPRPLLCPLRARAA